MLQAYVGIISRSGLDLLCPEHAHTGRFLCRRAARQRCQPAISFWAVIDSSLAAQVTAEIRHGNPVDALLLLESFAAQIGTLLPPEPIAQGWQP